METKVGFYSDGYRIAAVLYEPEAAEKGTCPGIVLCQGMIGIKEYFWFPDIGRQLAGLGYVALVWDYRGVGESEGEDGRLYPMEQAEDIRNALTYLQSHPKVDPERLALAGWSFGGGMVPYVAGIDDRVKCAISVVGWSDGDLWMRALRRDYEFRRLLDRIEEDKRTRVVTGKSAPMSLEDFLLVDPATDELGKRVLGQIPGMDAVTLTPYSLATAEKLLEFKPKDVVDQISPRSILYIVAGKDTICPANHVVDMYNRTKEPKKLHVFPGIAHYSIYEEPYLGQTMEMITDWLREYLLPD